MRVECNLPGERHAFVHLIARKLTTLRPDAMATFQVPHPMKDDAYVLLDAESEADASVLLARACRALVDDIDSVATSLGYELSEAWPPEALPTPTVPARAKGRV